MKSYRVAVFPSERTTKPRFIARSRVYDPSWPGCCVHEITAKDCKKASALAMREHAIRCLQDPKHKAASDALRTRHKDTKSGD